MIQLVSPDTRIDFTSQSNLFGLISIAAVVILLGVMLTRGFNLGVEFSGGTALHVQIPETSSSVDEGRIRSAIEGAGYQGAAITRIGSPDEREFRIVLRETEQDSAEEAVSSLVVDLLAADLGVAVALRSTESIGPRVGQEMRNAGFRAVGLACLLILVYIGLRFDMRYAPGAVAALLHDVIITAGIFAVFQVEFNLQVLAALLVVIGYSLNDTIVIYDRIRENLELRGATHMADVINQSINQTLSRTLLTSLTTMAVVLALLILGGPVIRGFAVALAIGVAVGTYSTIYVASALLMLLQRYWKGEAAAAS